ncbi:hypothetical protein K523DRAFT_408428 [Schizophyllum commune Tattone D]|nr:hypothetical protein K523DRAFT_408428 [Schizophyllum commune Tattone D]
MLRLPYAFAYSRFHHVCQRSMRIYLYLSFFLHGRIFPSLMAVSSSLRPDVSFPPWPANHPRPQPNLPRPSVLPLDLMVMDLWWKKRPQGTRSCYHSHSCKDM